ncbi:unnamed protein product [Brassica napus]|uniref:(rape) hypothetical protein n=1 Tax=Brassica napus TaxID=3708 RepID=A0A816YDP3_BRANA|nr:unnamed protein product [Brassica napus]
MKQQWLFLLVILCMLILFLTVEARLVSYGGRSTQTSTPSNDHSKAALFNDV